MRDNAELRLPKWNVSVAELFQSAGSLAPGKGDAARDVADLSRLFTTDRSARRGGYLSTPRHRRAYMSYFAPLNAVKVACLIDRLHGEGLLPTSRSLHVADVGAGPLSASVGIWAALDDVQQVVAVDRSRGALQDGAAWLRALAGDDAPRIDLRVARLPGDHGLDAAAFDVIVLANVLNELGDARRELGRRTSLVARLMRCLRPGGRLLIVEPATRVAARPLMQVRDLLHRDGQARVVGPCTGASSCPLLGRGGDWCWAELNYRAPPSWAALERRANIRPGPAQCAWLLLARPDDNVTLPGGLRMVGGLMRDGGIERRYVCGEKGLSVLEAAGQLPAVARAERGVHLSSPPNGARLRGAPKRVSSGRDGRA